MLTANILSGRKLFAGVLHGINAAALSDLPAAALERTFFQAEVAGRTAIVGAAVVLPAVAAVDAALTHSVTSKCAHSPSNTDSTACWATRMEMSTSEVVISMISSVRLDATVNA